MMESVLQKAHRNGLKQSAGELLKLTSNESRSECLRTPVCMRSSWQQSGRRHPSNLRHLEHFARDEWFTIPVERCKKLIHGYSHLLFFSKGCATKYLVQGANNFVQSIFGVLRGMISDLSFFSDFLFHCFSNANKRNKHMNTKTFVIAYFFLGEVVRYLTEVQGCQYFWPWLYIIFPIHVILHLMRKYKCFKKGTANAYC